MLLASCVFGENIIKFDAAPNAAISTAHGINNLGQVVGTVCDESGCHGFLRNARGDSYTQFDVPGAFNTNAQAINDYGQTTGNFLDAGDTGFLRSADGSSYTTFPGYAININNAGQILTNLGIRNPDGSVSSLPVPGFFSVTSGLTVTYFTAESMSRSRRPVLPTRSSWE